MTKVRSALIIGGGIAGPVAALALRKAGVEATVYEGYASTADGVGGQLTIAPNGLDALRAVGADEAVRAIGLPMRHTVMADGRGKCIGGFSGLADLPPSLALWRSDLYRALHDYATMQGVQVNYGKRLVGVEERPDAIVAHFADGTTERGDILIGADGIRSTVRTLIDPGAPGPQTVPLLNFGAAADIALVTQADTTYFVFGKGGFLGYWSQPDGRTAWFANLPSKTPLTLAQARATTVDEWLGRLRASYAGDMPARELLAHTTPDQLVVLGSVEIMPPVPRWHRDRLVLLGDAVHAPSPSSGQGASLAAESAVQLARCLRDLPDVQTAFAAYEGLRRKRVEQVAARATRTNNSKALGPTAITMMRLMMPIASRTFLTPEKMLGFEQRHRIDWGTAVAS